MTQDERGIRTHLMQLERGVEASDRSLEVNLIGDAHDDENNMVNHREPQPRCTRRKSGRHETEQIFEAQRGQPVDDFD